LLMSRASPLSPLVASGPGSGPTTDNYSVK
jgi:hypothetical protein